MDLRLELSGAQEGHRRDVDGALGVPVNAHSPLLSVTTC